MWGKFVYIYIHHVYNKVKLCAYLFLKKVLFGRVLTLRILGIKG